MRAIREFLKQPDLPVDSDSEGFVVTHGTGEIVRFAFSKMGEDSDLLRLAGVGAGYEPHELHGNESPVWFIDMKDVMEGS